MKPILDSSKPGAEIDPTPEEIWRLSMLAKKKMSAVKVAKILGRRAGSVRRQAMLLGILLYRR
jgi:hypothetical protein